MYKIGDLYKQFSRDAFKMVLHIDKEQFVVLWWSQSLNINFRVVSLSERDMGYWAQKKIDYVGKHNKGTILCFQHVH